jgi:hypothetical protein
MTTDTGSLETGVPKTIEQVAMGKVTDPFSNAFKQPYPLWHGTKIDKLQDILREGILAGDFAERVGKTGASYRRNFHGGWSDRYVSLARGDSRGNSYGYPPVSILVEPRGGTIEPPKEFFPKSGVKSWRDLTPYTYELWVKHRIAPSEFRGLSVTDEMDVDEIVAIMRGIQPKYALPIYFKDNLVWPVRMNREQLHDHVKSNI